MKANFHLKIDATVKAKLGVKSTVKTLIMPIRVMEPPRAYRVKLPDLTNKDN